ncbi:hypothetical protein, partial [Armatimonas sp.]|uniref:hypothetical protein n=1 Tax=Armatimonas sp. TaxID=1872638 RepID=UPI00374D85D3
GKGQRRGFAAGETHNDQRRLTHSMDQIRGTGHNPERALQPQAIADASFHGAAERFVKKDLVMP